MARFDNYVETTRSSRLVILAATFVAMLVAGFGLTFIKFDRDPRVYFGVDSPERLAFEEMEERYGSHRAVVFVVRRTDQKKIDNDVIRAIRTIEEELRKIPEIEGVGSLAAMPAFPVEGSSGEQALNNLKSPTSDDFTRLRERVADNPEKFETVISRDRIVTIVKSQIRTEPRDDATLREVIEKIRDIEADVEKAYPDVELLLTGDAITTETFGKAFRDDLSSQVPMQFIAMVAFLLISFRSITATLAMVSVLIIAIVMTMGIAGWSGLVLNGVSAGTVTVLMGLTVATCVHIMLAWQHGCLEGMGSQLALVRTMRANIKPVALALLTTVLSFLSLNMSDSPAFRDLGNLVSLGLVLVLILSFTYLPAVMTLLPAKETATAPRITDEFMVGVGKFVTEFRVPLLIVMLITIALSAFGVSQIRFDDRFSKYFDHRFEFRTATDVLEENFSGLGRIHFNIPAPSGETVNDKKYLESLGDFTDWLKKQDLVSEVISVLDLYDAVAPMAGDVLDDKGVPKSDELVGKLSDLIKGRLDEKMRNQIYGPDDERSKVTVVFKAASSRQILDFAAEAEEKLKDIDDEMATTATGLAVLAGRLSSRNTDAMLVGTGAALAVISLVMILALGNITYGLISIVPNILPLMIAYGLWGLLLGEVSFAGTMVCAMTFGIVVDDTVHFLNKYNYFRTVRLLPPKEAVIETMRTVGVAVVITTFALGLGFLALSFSGFLVNHHLGLLTLMTLVAALFADLFFLPALLLVLDRRTTEAKPEFISLPKGVTPTVLHGQGAAAPAAATAGAGFAGAPGGPAAGGMGPGEPVHTYGWLQDVDRRSPPVPITSSVVRIGRAPDNDVVVLDRTVHRSHAVISEVRDSQFLLTDLSPAHGNGVWLNGRKVTQSPVANGDLIELGEVRMRFLSA